MSALPGQWRAAVDWDDTLVNQKTQELLPGAKQFIHALLSQYRHVVVYTCRANYAEGKAAVEAQLEAEVLPKPWSSHRGKDRLSVEPKLVADVYIDNLNVVADGDFSRMLAEITRRRAAA